MADADPSPLARALGRMPTGLYVVSSMLDGRPVAFVGSFVVQTGFAPPTVCVAIAKGRDHLRAFREHGHFTLSILDGQSRGLMSAFFKPRESGSAFDEVAHREAPSRTPVLEGVLAWLDCKLVGEHEVADHVVMFGEVTAGELLREGEPSVHLRKNGLGY